MTLTADFAYHLPEELIAQQPRRVRDQCRLCVVDRSQGMVVHKRFRDLGSVLRRGDLLVLNNSRVVKSRIPCVKEGSGGAVEVFLLEPPGAAPQRRFPVFFKPARRAVKGIRLLPALDPQAGAFEVISQGAQEPGVVEWMGEAPLDARALDAFGVTPLPPYIKRGRIPEKGEGRIDSRYYQNIFARLDGSSAAPTAGMHFTRGLLAQLRRQGIQFAEVTLHVGAGTFLPLKTATLEEHRMHRERYYLSPESAQQVLSAKREGRRVIAVGTTSLRVLESAFEHDFSVRPGWAETSIFIKPGYTFKVADALVTNFHQPQSTLLALICAFYKHSKIMEIYQTCVDMKYQFLSYGDAMFIF